MLFLGQLRSCAQLSRVLQVLLAHGAGGQKLAGAEDQQFGEMKHKSTGCTQRQAKGIHVYQQLHCACIACHLLCGVMSSDEQPIPFHCAAAARCACSVGG